LAKDCEPGSLTWAERLAPSLTLNGKLTRPASWRLACKKAAWMQHLSGAMSPPSTLTSGLEPWIASLRASRAKTSALPDGGQGLMANEAASFLKSSGLPVIAVRDTSFWRTSQASLLPPPPLWTKPKALSTNAQPPASWENWPTTGGMRSGSLFQRQTLVPATAGRGGFAGHGGWASPKASDGQHGGPNMRGSKGELPLPSQAAKWDTPDCNTSTYSNGKMGPNIREQASNWPTPQTFINEGTADQYIARKTRTQATVGAITDLSIAARHWSSPKASDAQHGGPNMRGSKGELPLPSQAANWATPQARDHKNPDKPESGNFQRKLQQGYTIDLNSQTAAWESSHQAQPTQHGPESSSSGPTSPRRLNPAFTEWLMGWPTGWTIAAPSASSAAATALWRHRLHLHLSALCAE
jgi:hypothetical protein